MIRFFLYRILGLLLFIIPRVHAELNEDGDWQFWTYSVLEHKFTENLIAKTMTEFRFGDDMTDFYFFYVQLEIGREVRPWLEIWPGYRELRHKVSLESGKYLWDTVHEPQLTIILKTKHNGWKFDDRNRVQYRIRELRDNSVVYRNRLTITAPWEWTCMKFNPFLSEEIFVTNLAGYNQNRLQAGLNLKLFGNLKGIAYFLWRTDKSVPRWTDLYVTSFNVVYKF